MKTRKFALCLCAVLPILCKCVIEVYNDTTVSIKNNLYAIGQTGIEADLYGVSIGDVYFPSIEAGAWSAEEFIGMSGTLAIYIDSVVAYDANYIVTLPDITLYATITDYVRNSVYIGPSDIDLTSYFSPPTYVKITNNLYDFQVIIDEETIDVNWVDLYGVLVGDARFPYIEAGTTSATAEITETGIDVPIYVDSIIVNVITYPLGPTVPVELELTLYDIVTLYADIDESQTNTIILDEDVAGALLESGMGLARKKLAGVLQQPENIE